MTVSLSGPDADGLSFLLFKHPDRVQAFELPFGQATVFYPESSPTRCTAALLLEVDPIGMVRRRGQGGLSLVDYVTDRPYAASSLLAVALGRVFKTAMSGRCDARPELAEQPLPLEIHVPAVPDRLPADPDRPDLVRRLFEPLGWHVETKRTDLAAGWGPAPYVNLHLTGSVRLADALTHLYVLLPALDGRKHYWVGADEVDKLLRHGEGWLATHPERALILRRSLAFNRSFVDDATARLDTLDDQLPDDALADDETDTSLPDETDTDLADETPSQPPDATAPHPTTQPAPADQADQPTPADQPNPAPTLRDQRLRAVLDALAETGAHRVVDLGCGEGFYLRTLLADPTVTELVGVDVSARELAFAERRLHLDRLPERQRAKLTLKQSSVTYRDGSLSGYDACLLVEVVEHIEPDRLGSLEASVFDAGHAHVIVTTPNREYNAVYGMDPGTVRHPDHRFEWTRAEFADWATGVAQRHSYEVDFRDVGAPDPDAGPPTQMAVFTATQRQD